MGVSARAQTSNDATITSHVQTWICDHVPMWTIDQLLCSPHLAIHMGRYVCRKLGRPATSANISEICRVAMNARKRGLLKRG